MRLRRRVVDKDLEKQILIGLITSDKILNLSKPILSPKLFSLEASQKIITWITEYHSLYNRSPKQDIMSIFETEKSSLDAEVAENISQFLNTLSQSYLDNPPNEDYLEANTKKYLKKQNLQQIIKQAESLLISDINNLEEAEATISTYNKSIISECHNWVDPFDPETIKTLHHKIKTPLMTLTGDMGKYIGPLRRGQLIGILGRMKIGKTFLAQEFCLQALHQRLRSIFISLEMSADELLERFYQQIGNLPLEEGDYDYPVFDCTKNRTNKCEKDIRLCHVKHGEEGYIHCSQCEEYEGFSYHIDKMVQHRPGLTLQKKLSLAKNFSLHYGRRNFRILTYPPFSVNLQQILNDIDILEWNQNFIPDVIVLDYPDVLMEERRTEREYISIGETWKTLKKLAKERQVLIVVPTQTDRSGTDVANLKMKNVSGYIQKIAHSDKFLAANQTDLENELQVVRLSKLADRWDKANLSKELHILNSLETGIPIVDTKIMKKKTEKKK